jgi:hypothetical protein
MPSGEPSEGAQPPRPVPLSVLSANIPALLKCHQRWVVWRYELVCNEESELRWTKPPFTPAGIKASSKDPDTWCSFEAALAAYLAGGFDGIGFNLDGPDYVQSDSGKLRIVGFDFDHCLNNEKLAEKVKGLVSTLDSYAEISPGGNGLRVLALGKLPVGRRKLGDYECYESGRYLTITGHWFPSEWAKPIKHCQQRIEAVHAVIFAETNGKQERKERQQQNRLDNKALLKLARQAKNGARFSALYDHGNWQGEDYPSPSEADLALCQLLAFWTARDKSRMDGLFRASGLMRDKWDETHGADTYGSITLDKAISNCDDTYREKNFTGGDGDNERATDEQPASIGIRLDTVAPAKVEWLWKDRIPHRKLTLIDGDPGIGKSLLTIYIAAGVSRGLPFFDGSLCPQGNVVLITAEDDKSDTVRPRLDAAGADSSRVIYVPSEYQTSDGFQAITLPENLPLVEQVIKDHQAVLAVIDPYSAFITGKLSMNRDQDMRVILAGLAHVAERTGAAVILIRHLNKGDEPNPLYRGGGSIAIIGAARASHLIAEDPEDRGKRIFLPLKVINAPLASALAYRIIAQGNEAAHIEFVRGDVHYSAAELLQRDKKAGPRSEKRDSAVLFLVEMLRFGPRKVDEVMAEAKKRGITEQTLRRAREQLKVILDKEPVFGGKHNWQLPN